MTNQNGSGYPDHAPLITSCAFCVHRPAIVHKL